MNYKRNIKDLMEFRKSLSLLRYKEKKEIKSILDWRNKLQKKIKVVSKLINLDDCDDWFLDNRRNLYHKSGQFFKVRGVQTTGASNREVKSWTQPILTQKHGGVLAFICRETKKNGVEFLIDAKIEPGDNSQLKISPSFQATQSNMNQAHGGNNISFGMI